MGQDDKCATASTFHDNGQELGVHRTKGRVPAALGDSNVVVALLSLHRLPVNMTELGASHHPERHRLITCGCKIGKKNVRTAYTSFAIQRWINSTPKKWKWMHFFEILCRGIYRNSSLKKILEFNHKIGRLACGPFGVLFCFLWPGRDSDSRANCAKM